VGAIAGAGGRHAGPWRLVLVACCLLASATGSIASETDDVGAETVGIIDRAIHQLAAPSSDYRRILVDAIAALPAGADQRASGEIGAFLARAPQPGADFPCSLDFVKSRARKTLIPLRDTLRNEYVGLVEPEVCYTVPFALDRTLLPVAGGWLDIYGYDLNRVHPEMVLVNTGGYRDVSAALVTRSHYHLAFNLAGSLPWSSESVSLGLTWGHLIHYQSPSFNRTAGCARRASRPFPPGARFRTLPRASAAMHGAQGSRPPPSRTPRSTSPRTSWRPRSA